MYGFSRRHSTAPRWPTSEYSDSTTSSRSAKTPTTSGSSKPRKRCKWLRHGYGSHVDPKGCHCDPACPARHVSTKSDRSLQIDPAAAEQWGGLPPRNPPSTDLRQYEFLQASIREAHREEREFEKRAAQAHYEDSLRTNSIRSAAASPDPDTLPPAPPAPVALAPQTYSNHRGKGTPGGGATRLTYYDTLSQRRAAPVTMHEGDGGDAHRRDRRAAVAAIQGGTGRRDADRREGSRQAALISLEGAPSGAGPRGRLPGGIDGHGGWL